MTATPSRRKQILRDQKKPAAFKAARYKDARETIVNIIEGGTNENSAMVIADELRDDQSGTDFSIQDRRLSADAIEEFIPISEEVETSGLSVKTSPAFSSEYMDFGGTKVSMRPDALLVNNEDGSVVGCVKLNFSKSAPLNEKAAEYVATALRAHLEENLSDSQSVDPAKCYVVDIPTGTVHSAPKANKKRLSDLEAAGEEISSRWDSI